MKVHVRGTGTTPFHERNTRGDHLRRLVKIKIRELCGDDKFLPGIQLNHGARAVLMKDAGLRIQMPVRIEVNR